MFFANSGIANDPVTRFDAVRIVILASKGQETIRGQALASSRALEGAILNETRILRTADPGLYKKLISGETEFLSILFFGIENGVPTTIALELSVTPSKLGDVEVVSRWRSCPGEDCPTGQYAYFLGRHEAIDQYVPGLSEGHLDKTPSDMVESLVEMEVADSPTYVRHPIDILEVTRGAVRWISRKAKCQAN
jgi:hypothetical protein